MDADGAGRLLPAIPDGLLARLASEPFVLLAGAVIGGLLLIALVRMGRDPRRVRSALETDGLRIERMQLRYFTRGPFAEMRSLPGFQFSDRLYRIEARDAGLRTTIVWVRLFNRAPLRPLEWELRSDEHPERTPRGIGLPSFMLLLAVPIAVFFVIWIKLARHVGLLPVLLTLGATSMIPHIALADTSAPVRVPLCPGLTIVTAVNQQGGDYESIKTVEHVDEQEVKLKYSSERMSSDPFSVEPPVLQSTTVRRTVRRADLEDAGLYLQQFSTFIPETIPETTAVGTSRVVLETLKRGEEVRFGIFIAMAGPDRLPADRDVRPNVYDYAMVAPIRPGDGPHSLRLLVNERLVDLPVVHGTGDFFGDRSEFFFLDDPGNPLTLKFRIGIDGLPPVDPDFARVFGIEATGVRDKDVLQVTKISFQCESDAAPGDADTGTASALERTLADEGRADVYSIFFTFDSDTIREESEPMLQEIAAVLTRYPQWTLLINGHTDGLGTPAYNQALSLRRAAAVKEALVRRHGVDAARLSTAGAGQSQPVDTNETLEGRARNRRVELIRQ